MPPFASNPLKTNAMHQRLRRHPSLFGIPFLVIIVGASFGLQNITQTRYDLHDKKVQNVRQSSRNLVHVFHIYVVPGIEGTRAGSR